MRAVVYARYSTDLQSEASIADQLRQCSRYAESLQLHVVGTFEDRGISAGTAQRPGYQEMLNAARAGAFEIIVVEDVSRLWRSNAEFGPRSAELSDLGVQLVTCVGDDTRRDGWGLMLVIKQAIGEQARREISYRTRRGLEGLALAGKSTGGRTYGYSGGQVYPVEAARVRQMFELAGAGMSQEAIAARLNAEGVPTARGSQWRQSTVSGILRNERYLGAVQWGRTSYGGSAADSLRKRRVVRQEGPLVSRQDEAARIVDQAMWESVNPVTLSAVG
jgi:site-specific DNA recombinase